MLDRHGFLNGKRHCLIDDAPSLGEHRKLSYQVSDGDVNRHHFGPPGRSADLDVGSRSPWGCFSLSPEKREFVQYLGEDQNELPGSLFHEPWWLEAASQGRIQQAVVTSGGRTVGRLPFILHRKLGFVECRMPRFTHVLGPVVDAGTGKPQTQMLRRLSIIRELIDQLPRFDFFSQALDPSAADGLAFQDRGFHLSPQYTFVVDCDCEMKSLWEGMHSKTRQHIRRAEEKFGIETVDDPYEFIHFYLHNLRKKGVSSSFDFAALPGLFAQSRARESGEILCARWPDGRPTAMTYIVWGHGRMYYLLSTRADDEGDNGSVNLLIWAAMQRAHRRGLQLDLDGVSTSGTARFLSGFNGSPKLRMIVRRTRFAYGVMQFAKRQLFGFPDRETTSFT
jgi:hypothetical protein